jgi:parvulin-like peptidyl-prolyl isomerase
LPNGELDASFVAAAFLLRAPADVSSVVETRFGWHVIFLVERSLPEPGALAQRRADLAQAVLDMRARASLESMLRERRKAVPIELLGAADALMSEVRTP